jgi:Tat protein secretion system quality control protein TatD with DNase activity
VRLQKALNAITHGKNIFVYHNVRTKQVVYSLTRYLEVSTIDFRSQVVLHCFTGRSETKKLTIRVL